MYAIPLRSRTATGLDFSAGWSSASRGWRVPIDKRDNGQSSVPAPETNMPRPAGHVGGNTNER